MVSKSQIQFVRSLQSRKVRHERGVFVAEGPKVVGELLAEPAVQVQNVYATAGWAEQFGQAVRDRGGTLTEVGDQTLLRLSSLTTANGVVAVFSMPGLSRWSEGGELDSLSLVLDTIQDPGNLGTIIRCADWFGVGNIICSASCADAFNSKVVQATMGSIARVRIFYEDDLAGFLDEYRGGKPVMAAALGGKSLYQVTGGMTNGFLIIGNEARGVSKALLERADEIVTIPRAGQAESLNAGVATGILLFHLTGS